jgi:hypothetical protein
LGSVVNDYLSILLCQFLFASLIESTVMRNDYNVQTLENLRGFDACFSCGRSYNDVVDSSILSIFLNIV